MNFLNIIWFCWFLSEVFLNRIFKSGNNYKKNQDKNSLILIWGIIAISIFSGIYFSKNLYFQIGNGLLIPFLGASIILLGMIIRFISIYTLGKFFSVDVTIKENHKLINKGFYSIVRHPSYSGSILSFIGFGITLNNWLSLTIVFFLILSIFIYRIQIEEKVLIKAFGEKYLNYKKETYYLIPFVF